MIEQRGLVGLIGANIQKSLSPALHEDQFAAFGMRGHYHLMDLDVLGGRRLEDLVAAVKTVGFLGVNVTFPVKQAVMPLLDEVSEEAGLIGAVNTVKLTSAGRAIGYNTDCIGFSRSFAETLGRDAIAGKVAVLVGAGGAGRAVAFALKALGASAILVHDTEPAKASGLVRDLAAAGLSGAAVAPAIAPALAEAAGVVNATPIGMLGIPGLPLPVSALKPRLWVADVIYTPIETALIVAARDIGCRVLTGGGMCVHQAADAFRIFTGLEPDVARMRSTFARALARRDAALATAS